MVKTGFELAHPDILDDAWQAGSAAQLQQASALQTGVPMHPEPDPDTGRCTATNLHVSHCTVCCGGLETVYSAQFLICRLRNLHCLKPMWADVQVQDCLRAAVLPVDQRHLPTPRSQVQPNTFIWTLRPKLRQLPAAPLDMFDLSSIC